MTIPGKRVKVQKATPQKGYFMLLEFEDGTEKEVDLEPFLHGPIFEPIRQDRAVFEDVCIEGGTIAWANGADIDPDVLYYDLEPAWKTELETV
ncbi:MAG: DUF2442 domain-containing protein [Anaerolineae bacterium]|nr:DUF2442 domain-containing protein [Anaerolineae bacterium]